MSELDALLVGIVADCGDPLRWLVLADWLDDHGEPERAELVRVHRELIRTCTTTRETKARKQLHARMMELMCSGVKPCIPEKTLTLPGEVELRMSFIPPGSFLMGSPKSEKGHDNRETRHLVTLTKGFWLGQTPVTQRQWKAVMGTDPSHFKGDELPVEWVSWDEAVAFCGRLKALTTVIVRLPTEAEWEYAVRSGTTAPFYWGMDGTRSHANISGNLPFGTTYLNVQQTSPVGTYRLFAPHPDGLLDTIGNVDEWCQNGYVDYPVSEEIDPLGPDEAHIRMLRGGSWNSDERRCRSASRWWLPSDTRSIGVGFRLAASLSADVR